MAGAVRQHHRPTGAFEQVELFKRFGNGRADRAARLIGRSEMRTGDAINRLEAAGVLRQRNIGRQRYRVFEAADVVDLSTGLERALASPTGNTASAPPTRRVPRRASPDTTAEL